MTEQLPLPQEITEMIGEMVCTKRSNGGQSNNLVISVNTEQGVDPESVEDEVVQWVLRGLSDPRFDHLKEGDGHQYPWRVVSNVQNDGSGNDEPGCIVVAIRIGQDVGKWAGCELDDTGLIIINESPPLPSAKAGDILEALPPEPTCVTGVGVSAVSDKLMMELWADLISVESNTFDKNGKGFMVHPMWMRFTDDEWNNVREQSCNFGWDGYMTKSWASD